MFDSILTCYQYGDKSIASEAADFFLTPTRMVLDYQIIDYNSPHQLFDSTKHKTTSLFVRIILAPLALLMLPITLIASVVKLLDSKNTEVDHFYHSQLEKSEEEEELKKKGAKECAICKDLVEETVRPVFTQCIHGPYHPDCIAAWYKQKRECPECRTVQTAVEVPS